MQISPWQIDGITTAKAFSLHAIFVFRIPSSLLETFRHFSISNSVSIHKDFSSIFATFLITAKLEIKKKKKGKTNLQEQKIAILNIIYEIRDVDWNVDCKRENFDSHYREIHLKF